MPSAFVAAEAIATRLPVGYTFTLTVGATPVSEPLKAPSALSSPKTRPMMVAVWKFPNARETLPPETRAPVVLQSVPPPGSLFDQLASRTSQTLYVPGFTENDALPPEPAVVPDSPVSRMLFLLTSTQTVHPVCATSVPSKLRLPALSQ